VGLLHDSGFGRVLILLDFLIGLDLGQLLVVEFVNFVRLGLLLLLIDFGNCTKSRKLRLLFRGPRRGLLGPRLLRILLFRGMSMSDLTVFSSSQTQSVAFCHLVGSIMLVQFLHEVLAVHFLVVGGQEVVSRRVPNVGQVGEVQLLRSGHEGDEVGQVEYRNNVFLFNRYLVDFAGGHDDPEVLEHLLNLVLVALKVVCLQILPLNVG